MTNEKPLKNPVPERYQLLSKVAWLYYHDELTQVEISEKLGISRVTINRLLKEARQCGLVQIKVNTPFSDALELSSQVCEKFGLRDAVIVKAGASEDDLQKALAQAAAGVLVQRLQPGMTVGIGVGRTVAQIPEYFHPGQIHRCRFIGLTGGLDLRVGGVPHIFDTLARLAAAVQGDAVYIPAPSYLADKELQKLLLSEQAVIHALSQAAACDLAIFSLGTIGYSALLYQYRQITDQDLEDMRRLQAVGDVLGRFFDRTGREIELDLNERIIGLRLEELKQIPLKVLVAGGKNKFLPLQTAVLHRFCDILITDETSASWLVKK
jgi:DNA-binding transcriptional regulator LsrR (DeoR family)